MSDPSPAPRGVMLVAFTCGWMTLPSSYFLAGEPGKITFPATAYLIDHPSGLAVFDTGLGPRFSRPAGSKKTAADVEVGDDMGSRLRAIGVDPAEVRWIINSHLHTDHAGGNLHLPNATVIVQEDEWDYAFSGESPAYHRAEFDLGQRVKKISGEFDLFGDGSVVLFRSPGHTPGHQCARVRCAGGDVVLAADCCNLRRSLDEMRLPEQCFNEDQYRATLQTLQRLRGNGTRIFYGHDPEFWAGVPQGVALE